MFIAIVGTPSAGKKSIERYLVERHGFKRVKISGCNGSSSTKRVKISGCDGSGGSDSSSSSSSNDLTFPNVDVTLSSITQTWQTHYVTTDLTTVEDLDVGFLKRPFFLLVAVDGPILKRFERERRKWPTLELEAFLERHDALLNGHSRSSRKNDRHGHRSIPSLSSLEPVLPHINGHSEPDAHVVTPSSSSSKGAANSASATPSLRAVLAYAQLHILNNFETEEELFRHLDNVDLLNAERLRPGWDTYFMTLASLASLRSNCMKRRVGALLVRSKRILSTGYNGTPRGLTNCNQGGCPRCNGEAKGGEALDGCLCLHAEENALIEAGRERIGDDSVLYCNTCPCLTCSVKIVQAGVTEVVYNLNYSMDAASARVLSEGGVKLRQLVMPHTTT